MAEHSAGGGDDDDDDVNWNTDDEIDNFKSSPYSSPRDYGKSSEASSSKSSVINQFIRMGFPEDLVVKTIQEYGEENTNEIANALLRSAEEEKMLEPENSDPKIYSVLSSSDEENEQISSHGVGRLQTLIEMGYPREEASIAVERCGENASLAEIVDFILAAPMEQQFCEAPDEEENDLNASHGVGRLQTLIEMGYPREEASTAVKRCGENASLAEIVDFILAAPMEQQFCEAPDEEEPINNMREEPQPRRRRLNSSEEEAIHHLIPDSARGPPYFYYENVAVAPWDKISSHLYGIKPEFMDSQYFCAVSRKSGCIHNLPINGRFKIQPPPKDIIQEELPFTKNWWPDWDNRKKLDCLLTCTRNPQLINKIRKRLEEDNSNPNVQREVMEQCRKWNLVWVGKNKVAQLEPQEMEQLLGFPKDHTRGGGITTTERYKSLVNSFQINTVAYELSVLKRLYPQGIKVLSLFTGIGGGEVALYRLQIPMKLVVSVEISEIKRNIFRSFWDQTDQRGNLIQYTDIKMLEDYKIEQLMDQYGGFDLVIGGSPAPEGDQLSLLYEYCRILKAVRRKASLMGR